MIQSANSATIARAVRLNAVIKLKVFSHCCPDRHNRRLSAVLVVVGFEVLLVSQAEPHQKGRRHSQSQLTRIRQRVHFGATARLPRAHDSRLRRRADHPRRDTVQETAAFLDMRIIE